MKWWRSVSRRSAVMGELVRFLWQQRLWWLIPKVVVLLGLGVLLFLAQSTPLAPFVYTLF